MVRPVGDGVLVGPGDLDGPVGQDLLALAVEPVGHGGVLRVRDVLGHPGVVPCRQRAGLALGDLLVGLKERI